LIPFFFEVEMLNKAHRIIGIKIEVLLPSRIDTYKERPKQSKSNRVPFEDSLVLFENL
jgi:hypothetical protein